MPRFTKGDLAWLSALAAVTALLVIPATHAAFLTLTAAHPYLMGFAKFAVLATLGELLALRLAKGAWVRPAGLPARVIVWGLIGVAITLMFAFYSAGVTALTEKGLLPGGQGQGALAALLRAFYTSALMNLTFGPVFMAAHRLSDTFIDLRASGAHPTLAEVIAAVRWPDFVAFVWFKTIPLFWIPAHTLTFLLPPEYRVLASAYLSIVLGVILVSARQKKPAQPEPSPRRGKGSAKKAY